MDITIRNVAGASKWNLTMKMKGAEMPTTKCPICGKEGVRRLDEVAMGIHLMNIHNYSYEQAREWIIEQEELCDA